MNDWENIENKKLRKQFILKNFKQALIFVNKVAEISEQLNHHPDIYISYNKVTFELWTHSARVLSKKDFILAEKIEGLCNFKAKK